MCSPLDKYFEKELRDKTIAVIGAEDGRKHYIWDVAKEKGIKIVLVDYLEAGYINTHALHFIHYDYTDHEMDDTHADNIIKRLQPSKIQLDGCVTFNDCNAPLAAIICEKLNLNGSGAQGTNNAKSKFKTHSVLLSGGCNLQSEMTKNILRVRSKSQGGEAYLKEDSGNSQNESTKNILQGQCESQGGAAFPKEDIGNSRNESTKNILQERSKSKGGEAYLKEDVGNSQNEATKNILREKTKSKDVAAYNTMRTEIGNSRSDEATGACRYAAKVFRINAEEDIKPAVDEIGLPAILKYEYGAGSFYVKLVCRIEDCTKHFLEFQSKYGQKSDIKSIAKKHAFADLALGFGFSLVLMEYLKGTLHTIDLVLFKEQLIMGFVSDNGPTQINGSFRVTADSFPSCLSEEQTENLISASFLCTKAIGLSSGVFNLDMIMTAEGPKLLEINPRMTEFMGREWILTYYGVDLVCCAFLICCGIKPVLPDLQPMGGHMMGIMCFPNIHKDVLENLESIDHLKKLREKGVLKITHIGSRLSNELEEDAVDLQYCNIAVIGRDLLSAKSELLKICKNLKIDSSNYPVPYFLSHFK